MCWLMQLEYGGVYAVATCCTTACVWALQDSWCCSKQTSQGQPYGVSVWMTASLAVESVAVRLCRGNEATVLHRSSVDARVYVLRCMTRTVALNLLASKFSASFGCIRLVRTSGNTAASQTHSNTQCLLNAYGTCLSTKLRCNTIINDFATTTKNRCQPVAVSHRCAS